ncbi:MAG: ATP-binding protein [Acidobacteriota bacterium]
MPEDKSIEAMSASEALLEWSNIIEAMEDGVAIQTLDARIIHANSAFTEMLGRPLENILGQSCPEIFACSKQNCSLPLYCANAAAQASGQCHSEEINGQRAGQRLRLRVSPLRDPSGRVIAFVIVIRDVTDVIQREREFAQIKQLSVIGELAAGLAHEIKNPLAGIQGAIDILIRQREPNDPDRVVLEGMRREVARIDGTVCALLECARPRPLNITPASLNEVVQHAIVAVREQQARSINCNNSISINFIPSSEPIKLTIDVTQIEDALQQLILNAVEAIDREGQVIVRVSQHQNHNGNEAKIEIEDNGCGISLQDQNRIFSLFCTTKRGGTGLGLPLVRRIARAHGGNVDVQSAPGKGATFTLKLPMSPTW